MRKIKRFHIYSMLLLALFLHLTILNHIRILSAVPDLISIFVIFLGLFFGSGIGYESGLVAGFLKDIFSSGPFGINSFCLSATGLFVGFLSTKFFKESKMAQGTTVFFITIFSMALYFIVASFVSKSASKALYDYLKISIVPQAIYTSLVSIPIFSKLIDLYNLKEDEDFL